MFVVSNGQLGQLPDWVPIMQAALVMGVEPWRLAGFDYQADEIPTCWISWALQYERVDLAARAHFRKEGEAQARFKAQLSNR